MPAAFRTQNKANHNDKIKLSGTTPAENTNVLKKVHHFLIV